jgi:hypothetical protein
MDTLYEYMKKKGYPNIQQSVNTGPHGTVNDDMLKMVVNYGERTGWYELTLDEVIIINPGDRIRYVTNAKPPSPQSYERQVQNDRYEVPFTEAPRNKYRSGGWVISVNTDGDIDRPYILYRPHVASLGPQSIQFEYIHRLWYLPRGGEATKCRKPVKYPRPINHSNYPVCLNDANGTTTCVYYAKDMSKKRQFESTQKFTRAQKYGWSFSD